MLSKFWQCGIIWLLLVSASTGLAATNYWTGATNSDWFNTNNWSLTNFPAAGDDVVITNAGANVLLTNATASLASLTISNKTLTFSNWNSILTASNVFIRPTALITLPPAFNTNAGASNNIYIVCTNLTLDVGGQINADSKGYIYGYGINGNGYGPGAGTLSTVGSGAGYGGKGGNGNSSGGSIYGSNDAPVSPGSGGAGSKAGGDYYGTSGGGAVRIVASGAIMLNGTISANGGDGAGAIAGDGSGGGIYLTCGTLSGTSGVIQAKGGSGGWAGGGGGRIAVLYSNVSGTVGVQFNAAAGTGSAFVDVTDPRAAQMGTLYLSDTNALAEGVWRNQIKGAMVYIPGYIWPLSGLVTVSNALVGVPDGVAFTPSDLQVVTTNSGMFLGANLNLTCANLNLMTNSLFLMGSNGGFACSGNINLQSGAKFRMLDNAGLTNGGAITLGSNALFSLQTNSSLVCTGGISVLGATSTLLSLGSNTILTCGGSILLNPGQLVMSYTPTLNCGGDLTLTNGGILTVYSGPTNGSTIIYGGQIGVTGDVVISSSSWIYPYSLPTGGGSVRFSMNNLFIGTNSGFNADGKGYTCGYGSVNGSGPGAGTSSAGIGSGAGYGGKGGNGNTPGGSIYGLTNAPISPGSGGAGGQSGGSYYGTTGGGSVQIVASGAIVLNGTISANAGTGAGTYGGCGSGGGIYLICGAFSGTSGMIQANGGSGGWCGGGGGRIALWVDVPPNIRTRYLNTSGNDGRAVARFANSPATFAGIISANNGTGSASSGAPGTYFYFKYVKGTTLEVGPGQ